MPGVGARRHCAACDREVLDLSAMQAEHAIDALIARDGKACVRYRSDAAGEIQFAPPLPRRPGPIAAATLALAACAGWAEEPAAISPDVLGMCTPDADDPDACERDDITDPAEQPRSSPPEPDPRTPATEREYTALVELAPTSMGDSSGVSLAELRRAKQEIEANLANPRSEDAELNFGTLGFEEPDPTQSLFDRESTAGPGRDWTLVAELWRVKRQLRREERQRRREARGR